MWQNRCTTAEARLAAMKEQSESAKEEAAEWRRKHDTVAADTKAAVERAVVQKDRAIKQAQLREDALRADFAATVAQKVSVVMTLPLSKKLLGRTCVSLSVTWQLVGIAELVCLEQCWMLEADESNEELCQLVTPTMIKVVDQLVECKG